MPPWKMKYRVRELQRLPAVTAPRTSNRVRRSIDRLPHRENGSLGAADNRRVSHVWRSTRCAARLFHDKHHEPAEFRNRSWTNWFGRQPFRIRSRSRLSNALSANPLANATAGCVVVKLIVALAELNNTNRNSFGGSFSIQLMCINSRQNWFRRSPSSGCRLTHSLNGPASFHSFHTSSIFRVPLFTASLIERPSRKTSVTPKRSTTCCRRSRLRKPSMRC